MPYTNICGETPYTNMKYIIHTSITMKYFNHSHPSGAKYFKKYSSLKYLIQVFIMVKHNICTLITLKYFK